MHTVPVLPAASTSFLHSAPVLATSSTTLVHGLPVLATASSTSIHCSHFHYDSHVCVPARRDCA